MRDAFEGKAILKKSLKTSDPREAERKLDVELAWIETRRKQVLTRGQRDELIAALEPDQHALLEEAGGFDGLLANYKARKIAKAFHLAGRPVAISEEEGEDRHRDRIELDLAAHAADQLVMEGRVSGAAKVLRALGEEVDEPGAFGLRELSDRYVAAKKSAQQTAEAIKYAVRRFI